MTIQEIQASLRMDCKNPKLYFELGNLLKETNPKQAFLCYQNALYYASDEEEALHYHHSLQKLKTAGISVPNVSFVILNYKNLEVIETCINSIRQFSSPDVREIVIVDNASQDASTEWLKQQSDIVFIENQTNRGFPGGCNDGIEAANPENDIFLLNNDTILMPNALFTLRMALYEDAFVGATGSMTNFASNGQTVPNRFQSLEDYLNYSYETNVYDPLAYELKIYLVGFALLLKRTALNEVGNLDERFSPGNFEDNDIGLRFLKAGYKNILCHNSFIVHLGSQSFRKDADAYNRLLLTNLQKINDKYHLDVRLYSYPQRELYDLIPFTEKDTFSMLEIGCGMGATLGQLTYLYPNATLYGLESNPELVEFGRALGDIRLFDTENVLPDLPKHSIDVILMNGTLERCSDPIQVLRDLKEILTPRGVILLRIQNGMHYSVLSDLLRGQFSWHKEGSSHYENRHLYTLHTIGELLRDAGYQQDELSGLGSPEPAPAWLQEIMTSDHTASQQEFNVYQYLLRIHPNDVTG